jgi:hypothetical protein
MAAQKYFIQNGAPADTVLYFIPCLSPTMCFADARGIPNEFWDHTVKTDAKNRVRYELTPRGGPFILRPGLTIPSLDAAMLEEVNEESIIDNISYDKVILMRTAIQKGQYNGSPRFPKHGVDANRDIYFSLPSNQNFANFIFSLTGVDVRRQTGTGNGNCTIFMIHGYDDTKPKNVAKAQGKRVDYLPQGCVYGEYTIENGRGTIPPEIIRYVDYMTYSLFGYKNVAKTNKEYFFGDDNNANSYLGEWIQHLYGATGGRNILAFDIELGQTYNEGVRAGDHKSLAEENIRPYIAGKVGRDDDPDMPFFKEGEAGFFVPANFQNKEDNRNKGLYPTISFYEFLLNFYKEKMELDEK